MDSAYIWRQKQSQPVIKANASSPFLPWVLDFYTKIHQGFRLNCKTPQYQEPVHSFISLQYSGENAFLDYTVNLGIRNTLKNLD